MALLQVFPLSVDVLYSRSPPGAQPVPPSVGSWHAACDLEYHACIVSFCTGNNMTSALRRYQDAGQRSIRLLCTAMQPSHRVP